ncbi:hypothetical protein NC981_07590 [Leptolyngbya sp. DQ-M1]
MAKASAFAHLVGELSAIVMACIGAGLMCSKYLEIWDKALFPPESV